MSNHDHIWVWMMILILDGKSCSLCQGLDWRYGWQRVEVGTLGRCRSRGWGGVGIGGAREAARRCWGGRGGRWWRRLVRRSLTSWRRRRKETCLILDLGQSVRMMMNVGKQDSLLVVWTTEDLVIIQIELVSHTKPGTNRKHDYSSDPSTRSNHWWIFWQIFQIFTFPIRNLF